MAAEMIERVAKIIDPNAWRTLNTSFDSSHNAMMRLNSIDKAKAAITAMREPTKEMLEAAEDQEIPGYEYNENGNAIDIYQAMIDAALKE